jgi:hypothetical protein
MGEKKQRTRLTVDRDRDSFQHFPRKHRPRPGMQSEPESVECTRPHAKSRRGLRGNSWMHLTGEKRNRVFSVYPLHPTVLSLLRLRVLCDSWLGTTNRAVFPSFMLALRVIRANCTRHFRSFSLSPPCRHAAVLDVQSPGSESRGLVPPQCIRNIAIIAHG